MKNILLKIKKSSFLGFLLSLCLIGQAQTTGLWGAENPSKATIVLYQEDFESVQGTSPFPLPQGWTVLATPGQEDDKWLAGTLGTSTGPISGSSGMRYAYILTNAGKAHDSWAFSPALNLENGETYLISFYVRLHGAFNEHNEAIEVKIGTENSAEGMKTTLYKKDDAIISWWQEVKVRYKASETETHHIGFHSTSPASADIYASFIDDIKVEHLPKTPDFYGDRSLAFGNVYSNIDVPGTALYTITNHGLANLDVELASASSQISVEGLPLSIPSDSTRTLKVKLNLTESGIYNGNFVLKTNDTAQKEVKVDVSATGVPARITDYNEENFEKGALPEDWSSNNFNIHQGSGVDNSYSFRANPWGIWVYDFSTHIVNMGTDPALDFQYKAVDWGNAVVPDSVVAFAVLVSEDLGATYDTVFRVEPKGENEHVASADYKPVHIDLTKYANKRCRIKVITSCTDNNGYWFYIDNMSIGTRPENDLAVEGMQYSQLAYMEHETSCSVTVRNVGSSAQSNYKVRLKEINGTVLDSVQGTAIEGGQKKVFELTFTAKQPGTVSLYAEVELTLDEDASNNRTDAVTMEILPESTVLRKVGDENTAATSHYTPMIFTSAHSGSQSVYYPHELGTNGGTIEGIVWKTKFAASQNGKNVKIWLGETDSANLKNAFIDPTSFTKVFDGKLDFTVEDKAEVPVIFNTPYTYKGRTLVVYTVKADDNYAYSYGNQFYVTSEPNSYRSRFIYTYSGSPIDTLSPGTTVGNQMVEHLYPNAVFLHSTKGMGQLAGKVSDNSGKPLAGVEIRIGGTSLFATTDTAGRYTLYLKPGTYSVEADMHGYAAQSFPGLVLEADELMEKDIVLLSRSKYTLSGKISAAGTDMAVEGAKIDLKGYEEHTARTDKDGMFEIKDIFGGSDLVYHITVNASGYITMADSLALTKDSSLHLSLKEIPYPVRNVVAMENEAKTKVVVSWKKPGMTPKSFILDDSTAEDGLRIGPNFSDAYGNFFTTEESGLLTGIDVYGNAGGEVSERKVSIEILDADKQQIAVSEPFEIPANAWINVPLDNVAYEGSFYVMVRWTATEGNTNFLALDNNGPNAGAGYGWYETNGNWASWPGVFLIRAHANAYSQTKSMDNGAKKPSKGITGYTVYRLTEGQAEANWTTLATLTDTIYTDNEWANLPEGNYRYAVKAVYPGEDNLSSPVLTDILHRGSVGNAKEDETLFEIGPNPVADNLYIKSNAVINRVELYDLSGIKRMERKGNCSVLPMKSLPEGLYILRLYTTKGHFVVKVVKR